MGKSQSKLYQIYTDGSSDNKVKPDLRIAGTGFCLVDENGVYDEGGGLHACMESNCAELQACIDGITYLEENYIIGKHDNILILSDSQYLVDSINKWIYIWRPQKFLKQHLYYGKIKRKNYDQITQISDFMYKYKVRAKYVKSHSNNQFNEYVHDIAYNKRKNKLEELNYD